MKSIFALIAVAFISLVGCAQQGDDIGVRIVGVEPGSPAGQKGVVPGDLIVEVTQDRSSIVMLAGYMIGPREQPM